MNASLIGSSRHTPERMIAGVREPSPKHISGYTPHDKRKPKPVDINDLTDAQVVTIARFRSEFPDVKVWPGPTYGVVWLHTNSAGVEQVSRLLADGTTSGVEELSA